MQHQKWSVPVRIGRGGGMETIIAGPSDALAQLKNWPGEGGWFYERARNKCHAALEMGHSIEDARRAFVAATLEADMPYA